MTLAKYIADLLFDYECVIIPGLGGFIVNDKPAQINFDTHYFKPPYREVMFNPLLNTNDGVLLNYIAAEKKISYKIAKKEVDEFVANCFNKLNRGERVGFDGIGTIIKDENGKIDFVQNSTANFNPNSFGLTAFISPEVHHLTDEEKIRKVIGTVKVEKKKKSKENIRKERKPVLQEKKPLKRDRKLYVVLLLLLLIGIAGYWGVTNKESVKNYYTEYGSKVPVFYGNPGSYLANNVEIIPVKELQKSASALWLVKLLSGEDEEVPSLKNEDYTFDDNIDPKENATVVDFQNPVDESIKEGIGDENQMGDIADEQPVGEQVSVEIAKAGTGIPEQDVTENPPVTTSGNTTSDSNLEIRYYIIAGSFKNHNNAQRLVSRLQSKGFDAVIAGVNDAGMTRVAYSGFHTFRAAVQQLPLIRQQENPSAWIMRK